LSQPVYGRIMNYRIGPRTQTSKECLIEFISSDSDKRVETRIGQKVLWKSGKNELNGRIVGFHGRNGVVRARFNKGVPGQALGTFVELVS
jgi:large subunit ribosomal protein L35Ae